MSPACQLSLCREISEKTQKLIFLWKNRICWWKKCIFCAGKKVANFSCGEKLKNIMYDFELKDLALQDSIYVGVLLKVWWALPGICHWSFDCSVGIQDLKNLQQVGPITCILAQFTARSTCNAIQHNSCIVQPILAQCDIQIKNCGTWGGISWRFPMLSYIGHRNRKLLIFSVLATCYKVLTLY